MGFKRLKAAEEMPSENVLTARLAGLGFNFATEPERDSDIELTLLHASISGMEQDSLRTLSVLTTWLGIHHLRINAERLIRLIGAQESERVRAYWAAIAHWLQRDRRLARLARMYEGPAVDLLPVGNAFQIERRGEDQRFVGSSLRVPAGTLRDRSADVLPPEVLVQRHAGYRQRVRMGPSVRADVWAVLEKDPELPVAEIARRAMCSFATAWEAARDFRLLQSADGPLP